MKSILESMYELLKTIVFVLLVAFMIRYFIFQPFVVEGSSMEPNFHDKEYLIVNRINYRIGQPQRGDVIVFQAPDNPEVDYIKRIIGLPLEKVKICNDSITIDEKKILEKYLPQDFKTLIGNEGGLCLEKKLNSDEYFVMGDNREHSLDSREIGAIKKEAIVGKASMVLYPLEYFGYVNRPAYSN